MPNEIVITGLQELLKSMDGLDLSKQKTLIVRSLRKAGGPVQERIRALAPDDPETPGSRIAENVGISVVDQTATGAIAQIGPTKRGFAGIFAEEGTVHQSAKPFIEPAFDETQDEAYSVLSETLGDFIEKEWSK